MSQERTEKATPKRLKDARKKGQIARSRDLALAAASVAATMALARLGAHLVRGSGILTPDPLGPGDFPFLNFHWG